MRGNGLWFRSLALVVVLAACSNADPAEETTLATTAPSSTVTTSTTTTTTAPPVTTSTSEPLRAAAVFAAVQQELAALGYYDGPVDGIYGPKTAEAVRAFQRDAGITVDGEYGPETAGALAEALEADEDFVRSIQEDLATLGLYPGPVDGDYGKGTRRAVTALQEDCDLIDHPDGRFTPLTHVCLERALHDH